MKHVIILGYKLWNGLRYILYDRNSFFLALTFYGLINYYRDDTSLGVCTCKLSMYLFMYRPERIIDVNLEQKRPKAAFESQKAIEALRLFLFSYSLWSNFKWGSAPTPPLGPFLSLSASLFPISFPSSLLISAGSLRAICIPIRTMLPTVYRCNALPLLDRRPRASSHDLVKDIEIRISASLVNARLLGIAIAPLNLFGKFCDHFTFFFVLYLLSILWMFLGETRIKRC